MAGLRTTAREMLRARQRRRRRRSKTLTEFWGGEGGGVGLNG
jgi:hypothetical protein